MPIYEYKCNACEHTFEELQGINDKPLKSCPECKALKPVKLISSPGGFILKGPGFHCNDYPKDKN
jgi:putative FmdB family regulatory protein